MAIAQELALKAGLVVDFNDSEAAEISKLGLERRSPSYNCVHG